MINAVTRFIAERRAVMTAVLLLLVGNALFYVAGTAHAQFRLSEKQKLLVETQKTLATTLDEHDRTLIEGELLRGVRRRIDRLYNDTFQLEAQRFPVVDQKLRELAEQFGLVLDTKTYAFADSLLEKVQKLSVTFMMKGSYEDLREFVYAIEQAKTDDSRDLFFAIENIAMTDSTEAGRELNLHISVSTYFFDPERLFTRRSGRRGGRR